MKKIIILVSIVFLFSISFAQEKYEGQTIEQILDLPDNQIDIGIACLVITKEICPDVDIDYFSNQIDIIAKGVEFILQGRTEPVARIGAMNTFLYRAGWWNDSLTFTYDLSDLEANKISNQFLSGYLNTRLGSCITMPMLHLVLADRLGWPIQAVRSPKHIFCRYIDPELKMNNIEATCGGGFIPDKRYISDSNIPEKAIKNGVYLRTLSKKEYIASMLSTCARFFYEHKDLNKALYFTGLAVKYDSTFSNGHWNLHQFYFEIAHNIEAELNDKIKKIESIFTNEFVALKNQAVVDNITPKPPSPWDYQNKKREEQKRMMQPSNPFKIPIATFDHGVHTTSKPISIPQPYNQNKIDPKFRIKIDELQIEKQNEIESVEKKYIPAIKEALARSEWHKNKAKELGIVLELPTEFFIKQAESIEKFKKTGEY